MLKAYYQHDFGKKAFLNEAIYPRGIEYALHFASQQMVPEIVLVSRPLYYQIVNAMAKGARGEATGPVMRLSYQWGPEDCVEIDIFKTSDADSLSLVRVVGTPLNGIQRAVNKAQGKIRLSDVETCNRPFRK